MTPSYHKAVDASLNERAYARAMMGLRGATPELAAQVAREMMGQTFTVTSTPLTWERETAYAEVMWACNRIAAARAV